jgi:peptidoglycan/LPS O-acetylase OafA/YrhL
VIGDDRRSSTYQPALDGVRAVAVTVVLLFHLGLRWMPAGYLGVSVFFTLSGYLITTLLLRELHAGDGEVSFARFYARRARRLLPASWVVLVAVLGVRLLGGFALVPNLRAELLGALLQVFNWVQLAGTTSYGALFGRAAALTSPLEHYWSLAIEEQFYLVWPFTLVALFRWSSRRGRGVLGPVVFLAVVFSIAAPLIGWWFGPDAAYWSTPSRLPELLVGAVLAAWLHGRSAAVPPVRFLAPTALAAIVACCVLFPSSGGPAFTGWLAPFALLTAALVWGLQADGSLRRALSARPLVLLGRISYGVYLIHWPVFVLLRQHGWSLTEWPGAAVALGITAALSVASFVLLERPVRWARWSPRVTAFAAAGAVVVVFLVVVLAPLGRGFLEVNQGVLDAASIETGVPVESLARVTTTTIPATSTSSTVTSSTVTSSTSTSSTSTSSTSTSSTSRVGEVVLPLPPPPNRPVRLLVVGDSTAFYAAQGLAAWSVAHPAHAQTDVAWCQGCGFLLDGRVTSYDASGFVAGSKDLVEVRMPQAIAATHPDLVVMMVTVDDIADREWNAAEGTLTPRDPRYVARLHDAYRAVTDSALATGAVQVAWVVPPVPRGVFPTGDLGEAWRYAVQHQVIRDVAESQTNAGRVTVVDLASWFTAAGHDRDDSWRPDGIHLNERSAGWLAERWLGPLLVERAVGP